MKLVFPWACGNFIRYPKSTFKKKLNNKVSSAKAKKPKKHFYLTQDKNKSTWEEEGKEK